MHVVNLSLVQMLMSLYRQTLVAGRIVRSLRKPVSTNGKPLRQGTELVFSHIVIHIIVPRVRVRHIIHPIKVLNPLQQDPSAPSELLHVLLEELHQDSQLSHIKTHHAPVELHLLSHDVLVLVGILDIASLV